MILCGQQPNYLPWIGLFAKIAEADAFAIVDHVQYVKRSVITRNQILGVDGRPLRLSVPVITHGRRYQRIDEVEIDDASPWRRKHWRSLETCYGKAPFFAEHAPFFEALYARRWERLAAMNVEVLRYLLAALGLDDRPVFVTSEHAIEGAATDLLVSMCRAFGCDGYLSGSGARKYVDESVLHAAGLSHRFQVFDHPVYEQGGPGPFVSHLSVVDLLFWKGPAAGAIVRGAT